MDVGFHAGGKIYRGTVREVDLLPDEAARENLPAVTRFKMSEILAVIVIAGDHMDAPREMLRHLGITLLPADVSEMEDVVAGIHGGTPVALHQGVVILRPVTQPHDVLVPPVGVRNDPRIHIHPCAHHAASIYCSRVSGFDRQIYDVIRDGCQKSASALVPILYQIFKPKTVVDIGGGEGWFASEFSALGCDATVLDSGDRKIDAPNVAFVDVDLSQPFSEGRYNLALCLEVAEHLPATAAEGFIASLVELAPSIVFSAAIPDQRGYQHINEQWPQYWADLFTTHGFYAADIRDQIWDLEDVEPWYKQNILVFGRRNTLTKRGLSSTPTPRAIVHPVIFEARAAEARR